MKKIILLLTQVNTKEPNSFNVTLDDKHHLLAIKVSAKINSPKSFLSVKDEELLILPLRKKAIDFLKQKDFQVQYVLNIYWIHCLSIGGNKVCFQLGLT